MTVRLGEILSRAAPAVSGERIRASYRLAFSRAKARRLAEAVRFEQTVELPGDLIPKGALRDRVVGVLESFEAAPKARGGAAAFEAVISYPVEAVGGELPQLLNTLYGNVSLIPGVRLTAVDLPPALAARFRGPRFGIEGIRGLLGVRGRPLLAAPVKPLGLSSRELARLAGAMVEGGIDILKDDHGITNPAFSPFEERVRAVAEAVGEAAARTGARALYAANVTAPAGEIRGRALFARRAGAGALLVLPGIAGWDAVRSLADDAEIGLPILAHPGMLGPFLAGGAISYGVLLGTIARLAGVDAPVSAGPGGRFPVSRDDARDWIEGTRRPLGALRAALPVVGGGMSVERVPGLVRFFGPDAAYLVGGGLHRGRADLVSSCRKLRAAVEKESER